MCAASVDGGRAATQPDYIHRGVLAFHRAVTKLAVAIASPALDPAHYTQGASVSVANGDGGHGTTQPHYVYRGSRVRRAAVAQLTGGVVSPALNPTRGGQGAGVQAARGYLRDAVQGYKCLGSGLGADWSCWAVSSEGRWRPDQP